MVHKTILIGSFNVDPKTYSVYLSIDDKWYQGSIKINYGKDSLNRNKNEYLFLSLLEIAELTDLLQKLDKRWMKELNKKIKKTGVI